MPTTQITGRFQIHEIAFLKQHSEKYTSQQLAEKLNRTVPAVSQKLRLLKIVPKSKNKTDQRSSLNYSITEKNHVSGIIQFANTFYPANNQQTSILPVFKRFGKDKFLFMYKNQH